MHGDGVRPFFDKDRAVYLGRQGEEHEGVCRQGAECIPWGVAAELLLLLVIMMCGANSARVVILSLSGGGDESHV